MVKKWTPEIYQSEGEQIQHLALSTVADLNYFNQTIKMIRMSQLYPHSPNLEDRGPKTETSVLDTFELLLEREFIKRRYFQTVPTYELPNYIMNYPKELPEDELSLYNSDEDIEKAKQDHRRRYAELVKIYNDMNEELKSKNLKLINEETEKWDESTNHLTTDKKSTE